MSSDHVIQCFCLHILTVMSLSIFSMWWMFTKDQCATMTFKLKITKDQFSFSIFPRELYKELPLVVCCWHSTGTSRSNGRDHISALIHESTGLNYHRTSILPNVAILSFLMWKTSLVLWVSQVIHTQTSSCLTVLAGDVLLAIPRLLAILWIKNNEAI